MYIKFCRTPLNTVEDKISTYLADSILKRRFSEILENLLKNHLYFVHIQFDSMNKI